MTGQEIIEPHFLCWDHESRAIGVVDLESLAKSIDEAIAVAVAEEREACCKAMCFWCRKCNPPQKDSDGQWWHYFPEQTHAARQQPCEATAIRAQP